MRSTRADELALWVGVAVAFAPALLGLAGEWASTAHYGHGFLVPLVSAAIAHPVARRLGPSRRRPAGLALVAAALALYAAGLAAGSIALGGLALVAALCGLVAFRWGARGLRRLAFPLAFLVFMVPLPASWLAPVIVGLQGAVSAAAIETLHAFGLSVLREGNVMVLPGGDTLFVDEACSGITSLVTLAPLGVLLAWLGEPTARRRAAILAAVVPAALLGNFLRVVGTVLAARAWGAERATSGSLHELAGLFTFVFACGLLVGLALFLRARAPDGSPERSASARPRSPRG